MKRPRTNRRSRSFLFWPVCFGQCVLASLFWPVCAGLDNALCNALYLGMSLSAWESGILKKIDELKVDHVFQARSRG